MATPGGTSSQIGRPDSRRSSHACRVETTIARSATAAAGPPHADPLEIRTAAHAASNPSADAPTSTTASAGGPAANAAIASRSRSRPASHAPAGSGGSVTRRRSSTKSDSAAAPGGRRPISRPNHAAAPGTCSNHCSKSEASKTRTEAHPWDFTFFAAHASFESPVRGHARGVTNTK